MLVTVSSIALGKMRLFLLATACSMSRYAINVTIRYNGVTLRHIQDGYEIRLTVENTADITGKAVVYLYISAPKD